MFVVGDNGPYERAGRLRGRPARIVSLLYQPEAMRWRGVTVLTNTPPRGAQRAPGGMQGIALMEPMLAKAARKLGIDQVAIRQHQRAGRQGAVRPGERRAASGATSTSAFVKEALDKGAELFNWDERKARSGKRSGIEGARRRRRGQRRTRPARSASTACSSSSRTAACTIQSGIGNLGTDSVIDVPPRRRRDARHAVGEVRRHLGQHGEEPAVDLRLGRQPDDARDDARGARGGDRRDRRSCRRSPRRRSAASPKTTRSPTSGSSGPRRQHDARAGGAEGDRARRQVRRPRAAGGHQRLHEDVGDGAGRPGADGRGARTATRATARRSRSSPASPKSKSTSRPASTTIARLPRRSPTSAR